MFEAILERTFVDITFQALEHSITFHLSIDELALVYVAVLELQSTLSLKVSRNDRDGSSCVPWLDLLRSCRCIHHHLVTFSTHHLFELTVLHLLNLLRIEPYTILSLVLIVICTLVLIEILECISPLDVASAE